MNYIKYLDSWNNKRNGIVLIFFVSFFLIGVFILPDYGLSWDESLQWKANGEIVFNYIFEENRDVFLKGNEKYHGPAFELLLVFIEKMLHLTDTRDVFLMRHFITFLTFFISVIFFYFLCKHCFKDWKLALLGCIFLVLSPRIFSDAFYNSKDPVLLSFFIIGVYALLLFHERQTVRSAILYAFVSAIAIDIRILGIILPFISFGFVGMEILQSIFNKKVPRTNFKVFTIFTICLVSFIILFWPVLWEDPITHFQNAFLEMSKYHWEGEILYGGDVIGADKLPWHYLFVWIGISTPIPYLVLFFLGLIYIIKKLISNSATHEVQKNNYILMLIWFFLPLIAVVFFKSIVYDGWRHVYFVYPAFVLISICGLKLIQDFNIRKIKNSLPIVLTIVIAWNLITMIRLHPYEYVYFNCLAGKDMKEVKERFELDYYGVSSKQALEYILENDTSSVIKINGSMEPQKLNIQFLTSKERNRVKFVGLEYADYFIGQYRAKNHSYNFTNEVFSVMVGNCSIMSVFKLSESEKNRAAIKGKILCKYYTDFEKQSLNWGASHICQPISGAHSGKNVTRINEKEIYSDGLKVKLDSLEGKKNIVIKSSFWIYSTTDSKILYVASIDSNAGNNYYWNGVDINSLPATINKWDKISVIFNIPAVYSAKDMISIYVWNKSGAECYIDDVTIEFLKVDER